MGKEKTEEKLNYNPAKAKEIIGRMKLSFEQMEKNFGGSAAMWCKVTKGTYNVKNPISLRKAVQKMVDMGHSDAANILLPGSVEDISKEEKNPEKEEVIMDFSTSEFWGLSENPFDIDRYEDLYQNEHIQNVAGTIRHFADSFKFLVVSGFVGSGKSTLIAHLEENFSGNGFIIIKPNNMLVEQIDQLWLINEIISKVPGVSVPQDYHRRERKMQGVINSFRQSKEKLLVLIDEAHRLSADALRSLKRLKEGKGVHKTKVSVILVGQPYILRVLADPELEEVKKRCSILHMRPFYVQNGEAVVRSGDKIKEYIQFKLQLEGKTYDDIFTADALDAIMEKKEIQTPLDVNNICTQALVLAARTGEKQISGEVIQECRV